MTARSLLLALVVAAPVTAQQSIDPRLSARLEGKLRDGVVAIIDSARREGLPAEPLIDYALMGVSVRAHDPSITDARLLAALRKEATNLRRAREALGPTASVTEVKAGAVALRSGVDTKYLERLRTARPGQRIATGLSVLSYIVDRSVNADTAANVIVDLVLASATDDQLLSLKDNVDRDLAGGTPGGLAMSARGRGLATILAAATVNNGGGPAGALPSGLGSTRSADPSANAALGAGAAGEAASVVGPAGGSKPAPVGKTKKP